MKRPKTFVLKKEEITKKWYLLDAKGATLGRLSTAAADILRGKGKPTFSPHVDCGDFLVVINAKDVAVTGKKEEQKHYFTHSGYPGGHKLVSLEKMRQTHPERIVYKAVAGMLPQNKLSSRIITKLKVYPGSEHPHSAQKPETIKL
jgi:large subunit ribosomal protein L13